ncbi:MAG: tRNA guanosine(34) transglycosylase Tgt [Dictyoglomus sp.]|nr:tRNA guanosine(34) transglycosylase Tgt [Dictyoglomus sp.]MCX7942557.1 tRNA guanosine(34) transglycosylase Tgt [Dictyoglomaceae bacterium]MDW8188795.1 tRNA guanosine(34) transglycosylase Tgt [Dictyoglomus sp.]
MRKLVLSLPSGDFPLPNFLPDGTKGVVRSLDSQDLLNIGVEGLVFNTYHLMLKPGVSVIKDFGGLKNFINWKGIILTDSGGFQLFSIIRENSKLGTIREEGVIFKPDNNKKIILTPEKVIQNQFILKSDIMMILDYCTHPNDSYEINKLAVKLTVNWGKRCKVEYEKYIKNIEGKKPLIFGIIQGGINRELRKECAESLIEIGFHGFGFGGYPIDKKGNLIIDILQYTAELIPNNLPKYAMGIGKPENIVLCRKLGYDLFDCVIPTRFARRGELFIFNDNLDRLNIEDKEFYTLINILDEKYIRDKKPISEFCDCYSCKNYSRAFLHHLFIIEDPLAFRLATIHNLRFYMKLMELLCKKI